MMTKLKGLLFGKYVKQLFITSLVSCFILLGSSFVNAYESVVQSSYYWNIYDVNEEFSVPNDTVFSNKVLSSSAGILQGAGMSVKPLMLLSSSSSYSSSTAKFYSRFIFYWDLNNELNYLCNNKYSSNSGRYAIYNYKFDYFSRFSLTGFTEYPPIQNTLNNRGEKISVNSFYNDSQLKGSMTRYALGINTRSYTYQSVICFIYDDLGFSICAFSYCPSDTSSQTFATSTSVPNGANIDPVEFSTDIIGTSPRTSNNSDSGGSGNLEGDSSIIYYSDNNQIYYDTFKAIGFDENLCYSNFELTDTVNITTAYYDLFPSPSSGSGANIFELYQNWGFYPRNPFNSYYSWYSSRYNKLNNSSDKGTNFIMSLYSGDSIGNYYIFDKLFNNQFIDSYELSYKDYHCFCDMAINGYDPDDMNTCDLSTSFDNIMTNPGIRNGTSIGNDGNFILSGANEFGYFSGSAGIFDVFNRLYSQFRNAFRVDNSLSGTTGILPTYIIFGFFLFVLLYVLKR